MQLDTIRDLLTAIDALAEPDRARFRARVDAAVTQSAAGTRAALGLIALDLAGAYREALRPDGVADHIIVLPDLQPTGMDVAPVAASA
ncbi:MAG: hypothetical protein EA388_02590 [Nitriliruptor sp.]|nr:MAG: hypothetical protein EA388_02590 [Nitriliruptor sp.]